jgi:hypothetical protein
MYEKNLPSQIILRRPAQNKIIWTENGLQFRRLFSVKTLFLLRFHVKTLLDLFLYRFIFYIHGNRKLLDKRRVQFNSASVIDKYDCINFAMPVCPSVYYYLILNRLCLMYLLAPSRPAVNICIICLKFSNAAFCIQGIHTVLSVNRD